MSDVQQHGLPRRVVEIIERIAQEHETTLAAILGPRSGQKVSQARQAVYFALRQAKTATGRYPSLTEVGRWVGGRDHTSVAHGITRYLNPDNKRPACISVGSVDRVRSDMNNIRPVTPEKQADILAQWRELLRSQEG